MPRQEPRVTVWSRARGVGHVPTCWFNGHGTALAAVCLGMVATQVENGIVRIELTLDCSDLDRMARFWEGAVGFAVIGVIEARYVSLRGHGVTLTLQHVPEAKTVKNRMHLDLLVEDVEREVQRLEALGASRLTPLATKEFGQTWFVLADPEGNEFCVALDPDTKAPREQ